MFPWLDVIRIASRSKNAERIFSNNLLQRLLGLISSSVPNCMLIYRTIANLLSHAKLRHVVIENHEVILASMEVILQATDPAYTKHPQWKHVEIGISSVILNFATMMHSTKLNDISLASNLLQTVKSLICLVKEDEAIFRMLVSVGTLLVDDESIALASSLDIGSSLEFLQGGSDRVRACYEKLSKKFIL